MASLEESGGLNEITSLYTNSESTTIKLQYSTWPSSNVSKHLMMLTACQVCVLALNLMLFNDWLLFQLRVIFPKVLVSGVFCFCIEERN